MRLWALNAQSSIVFIAWQYCFSASFKRVFYSTCSAFFELFPAFFHSPFHTLQRGQIPRISRDFLNHHHGVSTNLSSCGSHRSGPNSWDLRCALGFCCTSNSQIALFKSYCGTLHWPFQWPCTVLRASTFCSVWMPLRDLGKSWVQSSSQIGCPR